MINDLRLTTKKVLVAPANYKGSISPEKAASSIIEGIKEVDAKIETIALPLSDGGEGFVKSMVSSGSGKIVECEVIGPLYKKVSSYYGVLNNNIAVVEMALASGLELITDEERDPWNATSYGTGELILHAIQNGCKKVIIGLGGSATNDGGLGMIQALGARVLNANGEPVSIGADGLEHVNSFDLTLLQERIKGIEFIAACDVTNPLLGLTGASAVYGPQKGADNALVKKLDESLSHFNQIVETNLHKHHKDLPGVGAAGGMGFGLVTFLDARLESGFDIVSEITDLQRKVQWADLIITGEGKIDEQTLQGKTIHRLAALAKKYDKKLIAIGGVVDFNYKLEFLKNGISDFYAIANYANDLSDSMKNASYYFEKIAQEITKSLIGLKL